MSMMLPRLMAELRARLEEPLTRLDRAIQAARGDDAANALMAQRIRLAGAFRRLATLDDMLRQVQNDRALWQTLDVQLPPVDEHFHCRVRVGQPAEPDVRENVPNHVNQSLHTPPQAA